MLTALAHNITIGQSTLIVDCGRAGYIPVDKLDIIPGQLFKQKTEMVSHACRGPRANHNMITTDGLELFGVQPPDRGSGPVSAHFASHLLRSRL